MIILHFNILFYMGSTVDAPTQKAKNVLEVQWFACVTSKS